MRWVFCCFAAARLFQPLGAVARPVSWQAPGPAASAAARAEQGFRGGPDQLNRAYAPVMTGGVLLIGVAAAAGLVREVSPWVVSLAVSGRGGRRGRIARAALRMSLNENYERGQIGEIDQTDKIDKIRVEIRTQGPRRKLYKMSDKINAIRDPKNMDKARNAISMLGDRIDRLLDTPVFDPSSAGRKDEPKFIKRFRNFFAEDPEYASLLFVGLYFAVLIFAAQQGVKIYAHCYFTPDKFCPWDVLPSAEDLLNF